MSSADEAPGARDTQADQAPCDTDVQTTGPGLNDDRTQLEVAIIRQMVVDAMRALAASDAALVAGRQQRSRRVVSRPVSEPS